MITEFEKELFKKIYYGKIKKYNGNKGNEYSYIMEDITIFNEKYIAMFYKTRRFDRDIKRIDIYNADSNKQTLIPIFTFGIGVGDILFDRYNM